MFNKNRMLNENKHEISYGKQLKLSTINLGSPKNLHICMLSGAFHERLHNNNNNHPSENISTIRQNKPASVLAIWFLASWFHHLLSLNWYASSLHSLDIKC